MCVSPPPATIDANRYALFERLERCVAYFTALTASPSPSTESPPSTIASRPTFYVFATGAADQTTASVLIRSVVDRLTKARLDAGDGQLEDLVLAGRADWTDPSSFASQCQQDPNTRGALVIETSISQTYRYNYLFIVANFTHVSAAVNLLACGIDRDPSALPLIIWSDQDITGKAHEDAWTLGILAGVASLFATNKTTTTVTRTETTTSVTQTQTNPITLSGTVLGFFQGENLNLPAQNASVQLNVAAERFSDSTMKRLHEFCKNPQVRQLAAEADPRQQNPPAPPEHRTVLYQAAYEYVNDCNRFAGFEPDRSGRSRSQATKRPRR
jgi:hypothetical protein